LNVATPKWLRRAAGCHSCWQLIFQLGLDDSLPGSHFDAVVVRDLLTLTLRTRSLTLGSRTSLTAAFLLLHQLLGMLQMLLDNRACLLSNLR
jgi:hypothetical protein